MNDINQEPDKDPNSGTPLNEQPKPNPHAEKPDCEKCPYRLKAIEDAAKITATTQPPAGTARPRLIDEIRKLEIPARCKAELAILCVRAKELGRRILRFLARHRHIAESILLGSIIGYLLCFLPLIGPFLSLVALATAVTIGMVKELREQLSALFEAELPIMA